MSKLSKLFSKNSLRMIKYQLNDDYSSLRYGIHSIKTRISNPDISREMDHEISGEEKEIRYNEIIDNNQKLMNLHLFDDDSPLVSIIINLHDSCDLDDLFSNFKENLAYPQVEVLVVDKEHNPQRTDFFLNLKKKFSVEVIENSDDLPYSKIHNITINRANGKYLLFLDCNLVPSYGWLNSLMQTALENENIGCVGAKVVYGDWDNLNHPTNLYKIDCIGTEFIETSSGTYETSSMGEGLEPFDEICSKNSFRAAFSKRALLISKKRFLEVGGFDETYNHQLEDTDLCLKLMKNGYKNIYSPNSLLFSLSCKNQTSKNGKSDLKLFNTRWNQFLVERVPIDKLESSNIFTLKRFKVGFAVSECGETASAGDYFTAQEFGEALKSFGWDVTFLSRSGPDYWYNLGNLDVVISLLYTFDPRRVLSSNKSLIKIAWPRNWFDRWVFFPWFSRYDLVFTPSKTSINFVKENSAYDPVLLPLATNPNRFNDTIPKNEDFTSDYCFTGSYWNDPREIIDMLEPDQLPYKFKLYGRNWDQIPKFKPYYQGFINYSTIPVLYASTKIVIDDANRATKIYGSVNSRVYDALATGALVLTNGKLGAEEIFNGELPVFESEDELEKLLKYYLENDDERIMLVEKLQKFVLETHTYFNRAEKLKQTLIKHIQKNLD